MCFLEIFYKKKNCLANLIYNTTHDTQYFAGRHFQIMFAIHPNLSAAGLHLIFNGTLNLNWSWNVETTGQKWIKCISINLLDKLLHYPYSSQDSGDGYTRTNPPLLLYSSFVSRKALRSSLFMPSFTLFRDFTTFDFSSEEL